MKHAQTGSDKGLSEILHAVRTIKGLHRNAPPLRPSSRNTDLPLSFAQQRIYFLHQSEPDSPAYNTFRTWRIQGPLNIPALERSLNEIVRRHEILRTAFPTRQEQPIPSVAPVLTLSLQLTDLLGFPKPNRETKALRLLNGAVQKPFSLAQGPLLQTKLLQTGREEYLLCIITHQMLFAGQTWGLFNRELSVLYETFSTNRPSPLPDLPVQYADFALWQRNWLQGDVLETMRSYWKQQLDSPFHLLRLPADYPQSETPTSYGARQAFTISADLTASLKTLSQQEGVTLFTTLLAVFKILLFRYTAQQDILIFSPAVSRTRTELRNLIGLFTNFLPLRTRLSGDISFRDLLNCVRKTVTGAYAHQEMPLE